MNRSGIWPCGKLVAPAGGSGSIIQKQRMWYHKDLGRNAAERGVQTRLLIRKGYIRLGGYQKARIYGLLSCPSGKKMKVTNRVFFADEAEARASGYRPCGRCLPEQYRAWKKGQAM